MPRHMGKYDRCGSFVTMVEHGRSCSQPNIETDLISCQFMMAISGEAMQHMSSSIDDMLASRRQATLSFPLKPKKQVFSPRMRMQAHRSPPGSAWNTTQIDPSRFPLSTVWPVRQHYSLRRHLRWLIRDSPLGDCSTGCLTRGWRMAESTGATRLRLEAAFQPQKGRALCGEA